MHLLLTKPRLSIVSLGLALLLLMFSLPTAQAQDNKVSQRDTVIINANPVKFYPTLGLSFRTPIFPIAGDDATPIPVSDTLYRTGHPGFDSEDNLTGIALNIGLQLTTGKIGIEYNPSIRYGVYATSGGIGNVSGLEAKRKILIDHHFNVWLNRRIDFGVGISMLNAGETMNMSIVQGAGVFNSLGTIEQNIQMTSYNLMVNIPIKEVVNFELKAHLIPPGFPDANRFTSAVSLRVYYKFGFLHKN